jgi:hypothetical protein
MEQPNDAWLIAAAACAKQSIERSAANSLQTDPRKNRERRFYLSVFQEENWRARRDSNS